jgi:hypothetical protein
MNIIHMDGKPIVIDFCDVLFFSKLYLRWNFLNSINKEAIDSVNWLYNRTDFNVLNSQYMVCIRQIRGKN